MIIITFFVVLCNCFYEVNDLLEIVLILPSFAHTIILKEVFMYEDIFEDIRKAARKRNLRESTIEAYCNTVEYFLRTVNKDRSELTTDDAESFLTEKWLSGITPQTYNFYHSSIHFLYKRILKMDWDDEEIPRMKRGRSLPAVLTRDEIRAIIENTKNLKHMAMIAVMYSAWSAGQRPALCS